MSYPPLTWLFLALFALSLAIYVVGSWLVARYVSRGRRAVPLRVAPISLIKPIKGGEESLADNLRSFFEQDYPAPLEIVFASTETLDEGIVTARAVAAEYPHVTSRFVRSDATFATNPKVANLEGALREASYDLVLQSDANVRIPPGYLRQVVSEFHHKGASLLSSLPVGVGEASIGAAFENLELSAFIAPSMCVALEVANVTCVVGKSMLFRRSELDELGGLALVKDYLAEDFLLGRRYAEAGKTVVLSTVAVQNVNRDTTVLRFLKRHARWAKMRAVISLLAFSGEIVSNASVLALGAFVSSGFEAHLGGLFVAVCVVKSWADSEHVRLSRGVPMKFRHWMWAPVKDLLRAGIWAYATVSRSVEWRGVRFSMGKDSRLYPKQPPVSSRRGLNERRSPEALKP